MHHSLIDPARSLARQAGNGPSPTRTLFTACVRDEQHELLSVRERGGGDISILVTSGDPAGGAEQRAGYRLQVHVRDDADGALIFYDNATPDGRRERSKLRIRPRRNSLMFPLYSVRFPDPAGRPGYQGRSFERDVEIAAYDPSLSVLVFHLAISSRGHPLDGLSDFNVVGEDVGKFRVSLLWGFMRAPSLPDGSVRGFGLPTWSAAGPSADEPAIETRKSVSIAELGTELRHARAALSLDQIAALKALFAKADVVPDPRFEEVALHYALQPLL